MKNEGQSFQFPKREKLAGKKNIEELFKNSSSFYLHPLILKYREEPNPDIHFSRALFSVPKKKFKKAVDRNLIKRRLREAYRLQKFEILPEENLPNYQLAFVYLDKTILPYAVIEQKLKVLLTRLQKQRLKSGESQSPNSDKT